MNGETATAYLAQLTAAWAIQQAPTSPPGDTSQLIFKPPLSSALYQEIRSAITLVRDSYAAYLIALQHKEIAGVTLTVPDIVQTGADEDLVLRVRASAVTSPPGGTAYTNKDFKLGVNGTLTFPNGTTQTGGAISKAELKTLVADTSLNVVIKFVMTKSSLFSFDPLRCLASSQRLALVPLVVEQVKTLLPVEAKFPFTVP
jgi:hypothetical protein